MSARLPENTMPTNKTQLSRPDTLQVIVKTVERCNLACNYCYYYFMGDDSPGAKPASMPEELFKQLAVFFSNGARDEGIRKINFVFHGGEPMLQKPRNFSALCELLKTETGKYADVRFSIQTNGYFISEEWINLFEKYEVSIGVSIDGPAYIHDRFRISVSGGDTHGKISMNVASLMKASDEGRIKRPGALCVIPRGITGADVYTHLTEFQQFKHMSFLFPDRSWDSPFEAGDSAKSYGYFLVSLFDEWVRTGRRANVRNISEVISVFKKLKKPDDLGDASKGSDMVRKNEIVVIRSDGAVELDDSLIPALAWRSEFKPGNIFSSTLGEFLGSSHVQSLDQAREALPEACQSCRWKGVCRGGALENRFSIQDGFNRKSVYCEGLLTFYDHIYSWLSDNGYPADQLDLALSRAETRELNYA
jgi:uncharacterized protein